MVDQVSEADIALNWRNVALARSQRILRSWLPTERTSQNSPQTLEDGEDDEDFSGEDEVCGLGSKRRAENDQELPGLVLKRQKLSSNDKLLQQLLGTKAANLKKKEQFKAKVVTKAAPTPRKNNQAEEKEEDEEEGRSSAFGSRKQKYSLWQDDKQGREDKANAKVHGNDDAELDEVDEVKRTLPRAAQDSDPRPVERFRKKGTGNFLDEILEQSTKKKSKKKKQGVQSQDVTT